MLLLLSAGSLSVDANAVGEIAGLSLSTIDASASGSAQSSGDIASIGFSEPSAIATGSALASASLQPVSINAPSGDAGGSAVAQGEIRNLSIGPVSASATGGATASGAINGVSLSSVLGEAYVTTPCDAKVSWLQFDSNAAPCDAKVSWLQFDSNAAPCDAKVSWVQFDSDYQTAMDAASSNFAGGKRSRSEDDDLISRVIDKWETIERSRERDKKPSLPHPEQTTHDLQALSKIAAQDLAAIESAKAAHEAITRAAAQQRRNEEALILILAQL